MADQIQRQKQMIIGMKLRPFWLLACKVLLLMDLSVCSKVKMRGGRKIIRFIQGLTSWEDGGVSASAPLHRTS